MIAVRHRAALVPAVFAVATAVLTLPSPASAAPADFQLRLSAPATYTAGGNAKTVEAVVSTDTVRQCQKVRWSMLLRVADGLTFDDMKVTRIEDSGEFPVQSQVNGDTARLTDVQVDPGQLCRGSTVTARYTVSFDSGASDGRVSYQIQALDARNAVLSQAAATSRVNGTAPASPPPTTTTPPPSPTRSADASGQGASDDATDDPTTEPPPEAAAATTGPTGAVSTTEAAGQGNVPSLLGPGLIVGGLFVFIGVGILLRLRTRTKTPEAPTAFYPTYRTR
jgi:hypothetical protein